MSVADNNYWKSYLQATQGLFDDPSAAYADALRSWWLKVSPESPPSTQQFFEKLIEQGAAYFQLSQHLGGNGEATDKDTAGQWTESVMGLVSQLEKSFSETISQDSASVTQLKRFMEQPFSSWEAFADSLGNGGPLANLKSLPAMGIGREIQMLVQQCLTEELTYQQVLAKYQQFHSEVGVSSCDRLRQALAAADIGQFISARQIYDLWVQVCEAVYAQEVATPAFSLLFGELVNAMMALQNARQSLANKILSGLGLPTQRDNQALTQAFQRLRDEQKEYQNDIHQLRRRCDKLEKEISKTGHQAKQTELAGSKRSKPTTKRKKTSVSKKVKNKKRSKPTKVKKSN